MAGSCAVSGARLRIRTPGGRSAAIVLGAASFLLLALPAFAAEMPGSLAQTDKHPSTDAGSSGNLSERLNQSGGVIKPPENVDPGMQKNPPEDSAKMPVIPPPGSPGGDPNVRPK